MIVAMALNSYNAPPVSATNLLIGIAVMIILYLLARIADDIGAMRRAFESVVNCADDIGGVRHLFETVVNTFVTVRMDDRHGFNFVMDVLTETLHKDPEIGADR
jgi:hypothetical protein